MKEEKILSKRTIIVLGAITALVLTTLVINMMLMRETPEQKIARLLDLGNQYLEGLDYEQAIASFDEVLSIEPRNEKAIEGEVNAYIAWSDKLIENGEYEKAREILQQGYENLHDERLQTATDEVEEKMLLAEVDNQFKDFAKKEAEICEVGDYREAAHFLTNSRNILSVLNEVDTHKYICKETGLGSLGVYVQEGGTFYLYYGDYVEGAREGNGIWIRENTYQSGAEELYYSIGEWHHDLPNGYQEQTFYWGDSLSWIFKGNVIDGLWNGDITLQTIAETVYLQFNNGNIVIFDVAYDNDGLNYGFTKDLETGDIIYNNVEEWHIQDIQDRRYGIIGFARFGMW